MFTDLVQAIPFTYAAIFPILNPLGSSVIFLTYCRGLSDETVHKLSLRIAINTFFLLTAVILVGSWVLSFFGITIPIVQIAGGIVVAHIGWSLLNRKSEGDGYSSPLIKDDAAANQMAFYPLTLPITAGPGCIAVVLTLGARYIQPAWSVTLLSLSGALIGIFFAAATVFLSYRYATRLAGALSNTGREVIMRLSAFINLCIGIEIIWYGVHVLIEQVL